MSGRAAARTPGHAPGFTLLEVMVALFIVAVAVVASVRYSQDNQDTLAMLRNQDTAVLLARAKAFELVEEGVNAATDRDGEFEGEHRGFRWEARAQSVGLDDYYRMVLRVRWDTPRAGSVKVERLFKD